jgi:hypothetical protein
VDPDQLLIADGADPKDMWMLPARFGP